MSSFGERLVSARKAKGYTQKQFAEICEISATRLNYWEKDKREPDMFMLRKIAALLDVDPNYLLGIEEQKPAANYDGGLDERLRLFKELSPAAQEQALDYMRYLAEKEASVE